MLKVHETTKSDGSLAPVCMFVEDDVLFLTADAGGEEALALPDGALEVVMKKYGALLEASEKLVRVDELDFGGGRVLRHVRHLARYDVIARDYLVLEVPGQESFCALATVVAGALAHIGRAAASAAGSRER